MHKALVRSLKRFGILIAALAILTVIFVLPQTFDIYFFVVPDEGIFHLLKINENGIFGILIAIVAVVALIFCFAEYISTRSKVAQLNREAQHRILDYAYARTATDVKIICGYERSYVAPCLTLLKVGRKAIATIVDFVDEPIAMKYRECSLDVEEDISDLDEIEQYLKRTRQDDTIKISTPNKVPFRLRYRFNPPDDASEDDLIHEIIIYNHQTEGLEPGTPISILYYINPNDNSDVISMPYPFPFKEIENTQATVVNQDHLYGHTKGVF